MHAQHRQHAQHVLQKHLHVGVVTLAGFTRDQQQVHAGLLQLGPGADPDPDSLSLKSRNFRTNRLVLESSSFNFFNKCA